MDRTVIFMLSTPIPRGHRIEVTEMIDESGGSSVIAIADLDSGIRYERSEAQSGELSSWIGTVLSCVVSTVGNRTRTSLTVDPAGTGASETDVALRGADAAADAAKAEADRWGGSDREPWQEPTRIW